MAFPLHPARPGTRGEPRAQRAARRRLESTRRILDAALIVAQRSNYSTMTRSDVAGEAKVANGLINHAFGTMDALRGAVMREAIERQIVSIVGQGLVANDPVALAAPPELREMVARSIA